jgi:aldose sugar dehydrogenase
MAFAGIRTRSTLCWLALVGMLAGVGALYAQQRGAPIGISVPPLGDGPFVFDSAEQHKLKVVVVTKGLSHPWSMVFLPNGDMLISERAGRLRIMRSGKLDPKPVDGIPMVENVRLRGLMDIALHPKFAENNLVYFTYTKPVGPALVATTLARGRFDGTALKDVKDLLVAQPPWNGGGGAGSRIVFGKDGLLYMSTGASNGNGAQDPSTQMGKILRLNDDGTPAKDNPFTGRAGYSPDIYSLGHRNTLGLGFEPKTGLLWNNENGPNGGDEINIILPGRNYGWPVVSFGRTYEGPRVSDNPFKEGMELPLVTWIPAIAVSGMEFYTGDKFPTWKGNVFVGAMRQGLIPGTGHMQRIVFNDKMEEIRREPMLVELRQRIRDIRQGPDGYLYLLTEEDQAALLRIEPTN